jgi:hypothetical protein
MLEYDGILGNYFDSAHLTGIAIIRVLFSKLLSFVAVFFKTYLFVLYGYSATSSKALYFRVK